MARCAKIKKDGKRCKAMVIAGSKYCLFHSTKSNVGGGGKPFRRSGRKYKA